MQPTVSDLIKKFRRLRISGETTFAKSSSNMELSGGMSL